MTEETRRHQTPMIREDGIGAMLQAVAEEIVRPTPEPNVWLRGARFDAARWDGAAYDGGAGRARLQTAINDVRMAAYTEGLCTGVDRITRIADRLDDRDRDTPH